MAIRIARYSASGVLAQPCDGEHEIAIDVPVMLRPQRITTNATRPGAVVIKQITIGPSSMPLSQLVGDLDAYVVSAAAYETITEQWRTDMLARYGVIASGPNKGQRRTWEEIESICDRLGLGPGLPQFELSTAEPGSQIRVRCTTRIRPGDPLLFAISFTGPAAVEGP